MPVERLELGNRFGDVNSSTRAERQGAVLNSRRSARNTVPFDLKEPVGIVKGVSASVASMVFHARRHRAVRAPCDSPDELVLADV